MHKTKMAQHRLEDLRLGSEHSRFPRQGHHSIVRGD